MTTALDIARIEYEAAIEASIAAEAAYRAAQAEVVRTGEAFFVARDTARKGTV